MAYGRWAGVDMVSEVKADQMLEEYSHWNVISDSMKDYLIRKPKVDEKNTFKIL